MNNARTYFGDFQEFAEDSANDGFGHESVRKTLNRKITINSGTTG
jgi:hypothetical protein